MISRFTNRIVQSTNRLIHQARATIPIIANRRAHSPIFTQRRNIACTGPVEPEPSTLHAHEVSEALSMVKSATVSREPTAAELYRMDKSTKYVPPAQLKTVTREQTLVEAASIMANTGLGFGVLLVVENGLLLGKISERRIMYAVQKMEGDLRDAKVGDWMMSVTAWVSPATPLYDIMEILSERKVRHLVILGEADDVPVTLETMSKGFRPTKKIQGMLSIKKVLEAGLIHSWETSIAHDHAHTS